MLLNLGYNEFGGIPKSIKGKSQPVSTIIQHSTTSWRISKQFLEDEIRKILSSKHIYLLFSLIK